MDKKIDLNYLLRGHMASRLSDQEKYTLYTFLENKDNITEWNNLIEQVYLETADSNAGYEPGNLEEMIGFILSYPEREYADRGYTERSYAERSYPGPQRPVRYLRPRTLGWAAAALVLLLVGVGLLFRRTHTTGPTLVALHIDAPPGGNKAVLTLANGRQIILDSAASGILARQGNTRIQKLGEGQLAYTASGGSTAGVLYNTLATPKGGGFRLTLPDGTNVWLDAASSIKYPTAFSGKERTVTIQGEAYLDVAPDPSKPFTVHIGGKGTVEVLGTHFNLNAYPDEPFIRTTLLEGSVKVNGMVLRPGEQARIDLQGRETVAGAIDTNQVVAWKNGEFQFGPKTDLPGVIRQLARWYDVDFVVRQNGNQRFGGSIPRSFPLSQVLKILQASGVRFAVEGKKVIVNP